MERQFSLSSLSDDVQRLQRQQWMERMERHSAKLLADYTKRYSARALGVYDDAVRLGLIDGADRWTLEHPTNPLGVEEVARVLGRIGHSAIGSS